MGGPSADRITDELIALLGSGRQVQPFTSRDSRFDLDRAYDVGEALLRRRRARGERPVGRKIGFTNAAVWGAHGLAAPIWGYMFDSTVIDLDSCGHAFALGSLPEPRIEPEIVLGIAESPDAGMGDDELIGCVGWVAHGFEIVSSIFPGWNFRPADAVAAYGVHAALLIGERRPVSDDPGRWSRALSDFTIALTDNQGVRVEGHAQNVLGSPLRALGFLVRDVAGRPGCASLVPGDIVTTGTLTEAPWARAGQRWSTALSGVELDGIELSFT